MIKKGKLTSLIIPAYLKVINLPVTKDIFECTKMKNNENQSIYLMSSAAVMIGALKSSTVVVGTKVLKFFTFLNRPF